MQRVHIHPHSPPTLLLAVTTTSVSTNGELQTAIHDCGSGTTCEIEVTANMAITSTLSMNGVMFKRARPSGHRIVLFLVEVYKALHLDTFGGVASKWVWTIQERGNFQKHIQILGCDHLIHSNMSPDEMKPETYCVDMLAVSIAGLVLLCARWYALSMRKGGLPKTRALAGRAGACSFLGRRGA